MKKAQARLARKWYKELQEPITPATGSALKGRVIVIDPGHTNCSPGAEGPRRLITEADLNWQVASDLAKLLADAGARVKLTEPYGRPKPVAERNTDQDLDHRAQVSNQEQADLFVSVHHNWTDDMAVNRTEVYYRLEDSGPSHDAGGYALVHLTRNLGLDGSLQPANYRVLRLNTRPALLTEASYMSNPIQESLLNRNDKQRLEAQAIYLGIADYFAHGAPRFYLLTESTQITPYARPALKVRFRDRFSPDRNTFRSSFDGIPAKVEYSQFETACVVTPNQVLTNGRHAFRFEARNVQGNAGIPLEMNFVTDREPQRIVLTASPPACPPGDFAMEVCATVFDRDGQPVADTRRVSFSVDRVALGDSALHAAQARICLTRPQPGPVLVTAACGRASATQTFRFALPKTPLVQFRVVRSDNRQPLGQVVVRDDWRPDSSLTGTAGLVTLSPVPGSHDFTFTAPGYRTCDTGVRFAAQTALVCTIRLAPLLAGTLLEQRVAIDPAGCWELPDTSAELAEFNLSTARRLAALLELAGARVQVSRRPGQTIGRTERLAQAGPFKPYCYLKLSLRTRDPVKQTRIVNYPGSEVGQGLAMAIRNRLSGLAQLTNPVWAEERSYEILNAPCAAVGLYLRLNDTTQARAPVAGQRLADDLAREILLALAAQRGLDISPALRLNITGPRGRPLAEARAVIDGLLVYYADGKGDIVATVQPGAHDLEISGAGFKTLRSTFELKSGERTATRSFVLQPQ